MVWDNGSFEYDIQDFDDATISFMGALGVGFNIWGPVVALLILFLVGWAIWARWIRPKRQNF